MMQEQVVIEKSAALKGAVSLEGAKNAVLAIIASLILTPGKSLLKNVPASSDVYQMIALLKILGADVFFDAEKKTLEVETSSINSCSVPSEIMNKMRASILVMGPLLARYGRAEIALPGGCLIGARPIDLHLKAFEQMGVAVQVVGESLQAETNKLTAQRFILDYPSVGATENVMMAAVLTEGITEIVNAALEPEVFDLISVLRKMGANISFDTPAIIRITGVKELVPVEHTVMPDRLEAGTILLAAAITGGEIALTNAPVSSMELFIKKLREMGHQVICNTNEASGLLDFTATSNPQAVSFKTMPHPGFPTDLQAPMMAALCLAEGTSVIHETVFENRMLHAYELQKMGAQIELHGSTATITGVTQLHGADVVATDIRASAALVIAGLAADGTTRMTEVHHLRRGYNKLDSKLNGLGAHVVFCTKDLIVAKKTEQVGLEIK